jgi:biotin carboxyl carrier protein
MPITAPSSVQTSRKEVVQDIAVKPSSPPASSPSKSKSSVAATPKSSEAGAQSDLLKAVKAPIPGVITAILVQPGAEVSVGQELCKLEAMKMNNSIRSSRVGKIASINVSIGQHVKHNDVLIEFAG